MSRVGKRGGESFISPQVQRERIEAWAKMRGAVLVEITEDLDESGGNFERPGLLRAIRLIEQDAADVLVVSGMDRFGRHLAQGLAVLDRIQAAGGKFVSVQEEHGMDTTTAHGELAMHNFMAMAHYHLRVIREQWATAKEHALRRGIHIAAWCPTGYQRTTVDEGGDGRLRLRPDYAPVIRRAFELRAYDGLSWAELAEFLTDQGVVGPHGSPRWSGNATRALVMNPVYKGEARHGALVQPDAHPAIVPAGLWEAAQNTISTSRQRSRRPTLLGNGLLRCAGCRYQLHLQHTKGVWPYYRCRGSHPHGRCEVRAGISGEKIEPWVVEQFFTRVESRRFERRDVSSRATVLDREIEEATEELRRYRDDRRIRGAIGERLWLEGLRGRAEVLDAKQTERAELTVVGSVALPATTTVREAWGDWDVRQRQRALKSVIDCVMLRSGGWAPVADRALILWRGEAPADLPRRGRTGPIKPFEWPPDTAIRLG